MCTDATDGAPTFPTNPFVNMSLISNTTLKDCCEYTLLKNNNRKQLIETIVNKTGTHLKGEYYYSCAVKYLDVLQQIEDYKSEDGFDSIFDIDFPSCDPNGRYSPVQKSG